VEAIIAEIMTPQFWKGLGQIIIIDLLLSGDNAVVIALAVRALPARQQRIGIILGAGTAIVMRIAFAVFITYLLMVPYLKVIGGALLFWVAIKMVQHEEEADPDISPRDNLFAAVRTIAIADFVMSLDNVIAIAGAAKDSILLIVLGLLISIPLIMVGSTLVLALMKRYPVIILGGAMLLGWIGGDVIISDVVTKPWVDANAAWLHWGAPIAGALAILPFGWKVVRVKPSPH
jgi:YjbE family integral membrane protein